MHPHSHCLIVVGHREGSGDRTPDWFASGPPLTKPPTDAGIYALQLQEATKKQVGDPFCLQHCLFLSVLRFHVVS